MVELMRESLHAGNLAKSQRIAVMKKAVGGLLGGNLKPWARPIAVTLLPDQYAYHVRYSDGTERVIPAEENLGTRGEVTGQAAHVLIFDDIPVEITDDEQYRIDQASGLMTAKLDAGIEPRRRPVRNLFTTPPWRQAVIDDYPRHSAAIALGELHDTLGIGRPADDTPRHGYRVDGGGGTFPPKSRRFGTLTDDQLVPDRVADTFWANAPGARAERIQRIADHTKAATGAFKQIAVNMPDPASITWTVIVDDQGNQVGIQADKGALDIGIIRDNTVDARNKLDIFLENFNGLADIPEVDGSGYSRGGPDQEDT